MAAFYVSDEEYIIIRILKSDPSYIHNEVHVIDMLHLPVMLSLFMNFLLVCLIYSNKILSACHI